MRLLRAAHRPQRAVAIQNETPAGRPREGKTTDGHRENHWCNCVNIQTLPTSLPQPQPLQGHAANHKPKMRAHCVCPPRSAAARQEKPWRQWHVQHATTPDSGAVPPHSPLQDGHVNIMARRERNRGEETGGDEGGALTHSQNCQGGP